MSDVFDGVPDVLTGAYMGMAYEEGLETGRTEVESLDFDGREEDFDEISEDFDECRDDLCTILERQEGNYRSLQAGRGFDDDYDGKDNCPAFESFVDAYIDSINNDWYDY